ASARPGAPSKNTPPQIKKTRCGNRDAALVRRGPSTWHTVKLVVYIATTRPRTASLGKALIHASPRTNSGAIDTPNNKRSAVQPHSEVTNCSGMTETAANATQASMTGRLPKRRVAAGAPRVPAIPPRADAATIQPTT